MSEKYLNFFVFYFENDTAQYNVIVIEENSQENKFILFSVPVKRESA